MPGVQIPRSPSASRLLRRTHTPMPRQPTWRRRQGPGRVWTAARTLASGPRIRAPPQARRRASPTWTTACVCSGPAARPVPRASWCAARRARCGPPTSGIRPTSSSTPAAACSRSHGGRTAPRQCSRSGPPRRPSPRVVAGMPCVSSPTAQSSSSSSTTRWSGRARTAPSRRGGWGLASTRMARPTTVCR